MATCLEGPWTRQQRRDLVAEVRGLSSGSISAISRQAGLLFDYQSCRYDWLEALQQAFAVFATCDRAQGCETWQDAWEKYVPWYRHVRDNCWTVSYGGSMDFIVDTRRYEVRWAGSKSHPWNGDYFETGIVKQVGCVWRCCGMTDGYPPPEVYCCFPGLVPLTATCDWTEPTPEDRFRHVTNWQYVYHPDYGPPKTHWVRNESELVSDFLTDYDQIDWETDSAVKLLRARKGWK